MSTSCAVCNNPKANVTCRSCESKVCKACVEFVGDDTFEHADFTEANSPIGSYCSTCYTTEIVPALEIHSEILERAKEVSVFTTDQGKESRLIKRSDLKLKIDECEDKDDLIMRLAYLAAKAGYNTIVDVDLVYTKKRDGSFKLANWSGTATAALVTGRVGPQTNSSRRSPSR
jgi:hypothetical protein